MDGYDFLMLCKSNYEDNKSPIHNGVLSIDKSDKLAQMAVNYIEEHKLEEFSNFFMESQYLVNLWAAHLILEFGKPSKDIESEAIEIIKRYSNTPLDEELAKEESEWLSNNLRKYEAE